MTSIPFKDISQWQGNYNMAANSDPIIAIKMGGGDNGLYMDSKAAQNYDNAVSHGKAVAGYWFAGGHDPVAEADYFLRCMAPLAENDVYVLDWEISNPDPVGWSSRFINHIHDKIGVWCIIYMNISTLNAHDWSGVLQNSGLWLAAPSYGFDQVIPSVHHPYIAQQGPIVGGVDTDMAFITLDELKKYGYHKPVQETPHIEPIQPNPPVEEAPPAPVEPSQPAVSEPQPPQVDTVAQPETNTKPDAPETTPVEEAPKVTVGPAPKLNFWQELWVLIMRFLKS